MKLENEHVVGVQTSPRKSYNPFDSDDEDIDVKSDISGYDIKSFQTTPDSLMFHLDSSHLSWEEAVLGHSQISADASNPEVLYRKDTDLFTDKTVTECELPELMFSYKDNGFNSVKDIGVDEGLPTLDKVWIKSLDNHDSKNTSTVRAFEDDVNGDVLFINNVEKGPFAQDTTEDLVKESGHAHEVLERPYSADKCGTDNLLKAEGYKHNLGKKQEESNFNRHTEDLIESDDVTNGKKDPQRPQVDEKDEANCQIVEMTENEVSQEKQCKDNEPLEHVAPSVMHELEATVESNVAQHAKRSTVKPSIVHETEAPLESKESQHAEVSPARPSFMDEAEANTEFNESQSEETSSVLSVELPALEEPVDRSISNTLSYNSKVESGSIILDFDGAATTSENENEENSQKDEALEKPPAVQTMSRDDSGPPPDRSILDCGTDKRVHGETSFSAAMPPPASIIYMGSSAQSGNISLRSESSAGSTRSFAFPVLQAEWNTSPVRMAKADQKRFSKQKGWVHSLVCCKF